MKAIINQKGTKPNFIVIKANIIIINFGKNERNTCFIQSVIRDDVKLVRLVRVLDCQSRGRQFDSRQNSKDRELKSRWI